MIKFSDVGKGTYVSAKFTESTLDAIQDLQKDLGLLNPVHRDVLHTTIVYSRVKVPYMPKVKPYLAATHGHLELWDTKEGSTLVLVLDSEPLKERHNYAKALGATYDFNEYKPHITLSYNIGAQKILTDKYQVSIDVIVSHEHVEDLHLDWKPEK